MLRGGGAVLLRWLIRLRDGMVRPEEGIGSDATMIERNSILSRCMLSLT